MEVSLIFVTGLFCVGLTIFAAVLTIMEFKNIEAEAEAKEAESKAKDSN